MPVFHIFQLSYLVKKPAFFILIFIFLYFNSKTSNGVEIFVSPLGDDSNNASISNPVKSFDRALNIARKKKYTATTIWVRGGKYSLEKTLKLTSNDSRTKDSPLIISAYMDEKVIISGGQELSFSVLPNDEPNLIKKQAKEHIYVADLSLSEIEDYGSPKDEGIQLYHGDKKMTLARFPNNTSLTIGELVEPDTMIVRNYKGSKSGKFYFHGKLPETWAREKDVWLDGYWFWDWRDEKQRVKEIDYKKNTISLEKPYHIYGYRSGQNYFAFNLLSELDHPDEWYLDRDTGKLYYYPRYDIDLAGTPSISRLNSILTLSNLSNIKVRNIVFAFAKVSGIKVTNSQNVNLEGITIKHIGNRGLIIENSKNCKIVSSEVYSIGGTAISIDGGNRDTLGNGNNYVFGNKIYNFATEKKTYNPGVLISGVGNHIKNNEIFSSPHSAIIFHGNNHIIEKNEIHNVVSNSTDAGAIYGGRDWSSRGHIIRYNYIHDINGYQNLGAKGIYLDDELSGVTIYGNVFKNVKDSVFIGGGRDNLISSNIFINSEPAIYIDARGVGWARGAITELLKKLDKVPYDSPVWRNHYPNLTGVLNDHPRLPVGNRVSSNVFDTKSWSVITKEAKPYIEFENNVYFEKSPTSQ